MKIDFFLVIVEAESQQLQCFDKKRFRLPIHPILKNNGRNSLPILKMEKNLIMTTPRSYGQDKQYRKSYLAIFKLNITKWRQYENFNVL